MNFNDTQIERLDRCLKTAAKLRGDFMGGVYQMMSDAEEIATTLSKEGPTVTKTDVLDWLNLRGS